jgi:hypothetical protein
VSVVDYATLNCRSENCHSDWRVAANPAKNAGQAGRPPSAEGPFAEHAVGLFADRTRLSLLEE